MHFRILKMIAIRGFLTALECNKFDFGRCCSLAGLRGPTSKVRGGEEIGEGQGTGNGREGVGMPGKGEGMRGEGRRRGGGGEGKKSKTTSSVKFLPTPLR